MGVELLPQRRNRSGPARKSLESGAGGRPLLTDRRGSERGSDRYSRSNMAPPCPSKSNARHHSRQSRRGRRSDREFNAGSVPGASAVRSILKFEPPMLLDARRRIPGTPLRSWDSWGASRVRDLGAVNPRTVGSCPRPAGAIMRLFPPHRPDPGGRPAVSFALLLVLLPLAAAATDRTDLAARSRTPRCRHAGPPARGTRCDPRRRGPGRSDPLRRQGPAFSRGAPRRVVAETASLPGATTTEAAARSCFSRPTRGCRGSSRSGSCRPRPTPGSSSGGTSSRRGPGRTDARGRSGSRLRATRSCCPIFDAPNPPISLRVRISLHPDRAADPEAVAAPVSDAFTAHPKHWVVLTIWTPIHRPRRPHGVRRRNLDVALRAGIRRVLLHGLPPPEPGARGAGSRRPSRLRRRRRGGSVRRAAWWKARLGQPALTMDWYCSTSSLLYTSLSRGRRASGAGRYRPRRPAVEPCT